MEHSGDDLSGGAGGEEERLRSIDGAVLKADGEGEERGGCQTDEAVVLPAATPAAPPSPSSSSSFRKFRNLLMAKKFETHDNLPCGQPANVASIVCAQWDMNPQIQVLPEGLFIGSFGAATNLSALQQLGISHILCVSGSLALQFPESFEYLRLSIADLPTARITDAFPAAFAFIDRAIASGGNVLVHCYLGKSRSATIILAFLIASKRMNLNDAMAFLKRARPQVHPNSGFQLELQQFESCSNNWSTKNPGSWY